MPKEIRKRDGRVVPFDAGKIRAAIEKALKAVGGNTDAAKGLADATVKMVEQNTGSETPTVELVQDAVEKTLIANGEAEAAKAYILYRRERADVRAAKKLIGVSDDLKLSVNAACVLERRYLVKDDRGVVVETPGAMFRRVAHAVAQADANYGTASDVEKAEEEFYELMTRFEFLPNSPTLMNAGTEMGQLSACFVLPVEDSIEGIFRSVGEMALIHQSGGGTGFSFSRLRPKGDMVRSTHGVASGPVSFMSVFDSATEVIKQGGRRRGANMGILHVSHPDIMEFITSKVGGERLRNFNISVAVDDAFMAALAAGSDYKLVNPRNGETTAVMKASDIFSAIVTAAWQCADPGLVFIDEINRHNQTPAAGRIEATNPCGEQPLLPYESCNLGSVNLALMVRDGGIDYERLERVIRSGVHFLDNVIDVGAFPLDRVREATRENRKTGLGVMGWAEMLIQLGIPYDSDEALKAALVSGQGEGYDGASFVAVQQWVHDLDAFQAKPASEQDNIIGRRKSDNEELEDAPESAHVKRTAQEDFVPEAFVLRRSMPWTCGMESGLVFVAFGRSFDAFEAQLIRMVGAEDGITDAVFTFTRPISGSYFWCPPIRDGHLDLSALDV